MTEAIPFFARLIIGVVLVAAGVGKLRSRTWPALAVEMGTPKIVVLTLPAIEVMLGLALIVQLGGPLPSWIACAMFVAFTGVLVARYRKGDERPCNCFGRGKGMITRVTIGRNALLIAVAAIGGW